MARLAIRLLGPMQVMLDGNPVTRYETEKVRALLAYLATETDSPQRRDAIAEMLWPERPEGAARANLRHTLASLRSVLRAEAADGLSEPFLLATRQTVRLNPEADIDVDVQDFRALLHSDRPASALGTEGPSREELEAAAALCQGSFLSDISISDSTAFSEWLLVTRERLNRDALQALRQLTSLVEQLGEWDRALAYTRQQLSLEPCDERAHREMMRLLALTGQRRAALAQYDICRSLLADELDVAPEIETTQLWQQIKDNTLPAPHWAQQHWQEEQEGGPARGPAEAPMPFVARQRELAHLDALLAQALRGATQFAFVSGAAGLGKTALLDAFIRQAQMANSDLLVTRGACAAYAGAGEPYLPFRDALAMLTGDLISHRVSGGIGPEGVQRLQHSLPDTIHLLLSRGPALIGTLVAGESLLSRVAEAFPDHDEWLEYIRRLMTRTDREASPPEQSFLFEQVVGVLSALASRHPLLVVIDDLQWADTASIYLLFHLGRRLSRAPHRLMILSAYRPEDLVPSPSGARHALEKPLHELKRLYGDVWVDLDSTEPEEDRRFLEALLDSTPNRLGSAFRDALYRRTGGHPLFTVELLRAMQERGDMVREAGPDSPWQEAPTLNWDALPARVEAVIGERIARLDPPLQDLLGVASVVGASFSAHVVAVVLGLPDRECLQALGKLSWLHHLVQIQSEAQAGVGWTVVYQFSHILVQIFVYRRLGAGERLFLHRRIAETLQDLHRGEVDSVAAQLAYHYLHANAPELALRYAVRAAAAAARTHAHQAAAELYSQAIDLARRLPLAPGELANLQRQRGLIHEALGHFEAARLDFEGCRHLGDTSGSRRITWRAMLDLVRVWAMRDYGRSRELINDTLDLARQIDDPAVLATTLNRAGNWWLNAEDLPAAVEHHQNALAIFEEIGDTRAAAHTMDDLGLASQMMCDLTASVAYYNRSIAAFDELEDRAGLTSSLIGRGVATGAMNLAGTAVPVTKAARAGRDFEQALQIAREIHAPAAESWALWAMGLHDLWSGKLGQALSAVTEAEDVASSIGHVEWTVAAHVIRGAIYVELLATERARAELREALALAEGLKSRHWIHYATSLWAASCCACGELAAAGACLDDILSPAAQMNTVHLRSCWARRAELALAQSEPAIALDIVDRLIASAPGLKPERHPRPVIPMLWHLRGEALAALGNAEAGAVLVAAALAATESSVARLPLWRLHGTLARLYELLGRQEEAAAERAAALVSIEQLAGTVPDPQLREDFLNRATAKLG